MEKKTPTQDLYGNMQQNRLMKQQNDATALGAYALAKLRRTDLVTVKDEFDYSKFKHTSTPITFDF